MKPVLSTDKYAQCNFCSCRKNIAEMKHPSPNKSIVIYICSNCATTIFNFFNTKDEQTRNTRIQ